MNSNITIRITVILAILVLLSTSPIQAATSIPFTSQVIDSANSGDDKAVADIDNDGFADGILGGSSLVWYDSGHDYAKHVIRSTVIYGEFTTDMQAADVDGDGDADLILGDGDGANNVLWFENPLINPPDGLDADPKVEANWTYHVIGTHGANVHDLEIGDFNNDGQLDVVTGGNDHTHVWVQVTPTSWQDKDLSDLSGRGISVGDIDRDGYADIAILANWLKNPGDPINGTWTRYPIANVIGGNDEVLAADLNGDGRIDLIFASAHERQEFAWFMAPEDPTSPDWEKHVIDPAMGAHHPEIADFNNDGKLDILMGLELVDLSIYLNNGETTPTFTKEQIDTTAGHNARAGDLNGDGKVDIFASDYIGFPPVKIYLNGGSTSPPSTPTRTFTPAPTNTRTPLPTATRTLQPTNTRTPLPTATQTLQPTNTRTPLPTATQTLQPTNTRTPLPTATRTLQPTNTRTPLPTATQTLQPTNTRTPLPTATRTLQPTSTRTLIPTATRTLEPTKPPINTPTRTLPPTSTPTRTLQPTSTRTLIPTATRTLEPTKPPINTPTRTLPPTSTPTRTLPPTSTPTRTLQPTSTPTRTLQPTNTPTRTPPPTSTPTRTLQPTNTPVSPSPSGAMVLGLGFETGTGTTAVDSSTFGNSGTLRNGAQWTTQGKYGGAILFDGVDDRVSVADAPSLDLTTALTIEAWVYPTKVNNWSTIIMKELGANFSYVLYAYWFGTDTAGGTYNGQERITSGGGALPLNTWTHVALTYDGVQQKLYVNGNLVVAYDISGALTPSDLGIGIGGNSQWGNEVFTGRIDEVRIYNVARSQAQIQSDMSAPITSAKSTPGADPTNAGVDMPTATWTPTSTMTPPPSLTPTTAPVQPTLAPTTVPATGVPPSGEPLVLGLPFDDGAGTTAVDSSTFGNSGTLRNGAQWTTQGKYGGAILFDGVDDRVSVADAPSLDLTTALTIEAWVYPTKVNNWSTIIMKELGANFSYVLYAYWFGTDTAGGTYNGQERITSGGGALPLNTWTHVALTYDGVQQKLYVNGNLVVAYDISGALTPSDLGIGIGGNSQWGNEVFTGRIDEVRIYNVALSPQQIQTDMNTPLQAAAAPTPVFSPTAEASATATLEVMPTTEVTTDASATVEPTATNPPSPTPSATATIAPSLTPTPSPTASLMPSPTFTPTFTPTPTASPTMTPGGSSDV